MSVSVKSETASRVATATPKGRGGETQEVERAEGQDKREREGPNNGRGRHRAWESPVTMQKERKEKNLFSENKGQDSKTSAVNSSSSLY